MTVAKSQSKSYQAAIGVRGDCAYCPLPLSIDSYWNCLTDCHHCVFRRLNRTWGTDLRPADPEDVKRKLFNGVRNKEPKSSLAWALYHKKTIRLGNKTDPYQDAEREFYISRKIQQALIRLKWTYVIQTRFLSNLELDEPFVWDANFHHLIQVMPVISPGAEKDWEILERQRTTPIPQRLKIIRHWIRHGIDIGVNGEPFIPGYHTPKDFQDMIRRLKGVGVKSYNTYNLHFNDYVAKRLHGIGVDIEKIWYYNQDARWKVILKELLDIAKKEDMRLGCPDFVNTGWGWKEQANTCCGLNVPNPSRFNTHHWKRKIQNGGNPDRILERTWEGIGDKEQGMRIMNQKSKTFFTMDDIQ